ncbi:DUF4429 domain-containing protein [Streptomyces armeniacus]|uniref:DUF4429 domain-containing protein n=1 Tax=Streptomyces armeniacus TaxID=83291 RepID=A0A345XNP9_9ACTN|nr:DUF4429 domain-containing protein [Streptomyces armeniacus]AXK33265.1 DUF4429 domain-containing protein [Streptomyces armeniacus]
MAEIIQRAGTWTFDGSTVRIVPGSWKGVHQLRRSLGEVAVPLTAVAGIAYEAGRKGGRLRLRLREGADPLAQVASGRLTDAADPYQLAVETDRAGVAEYFVDEVRNALLLEQVPDTPCDRYLLPGPSVPLTAAGTDGTASFDGERVQIEWNWLTEESKSSGGPRTLALRELAAVEWTPATGWENGSLRFRPKGTHATVKPQHDPNCLLLWGIRQARETGGSVLLAAAVTARLPHPAASGASGAPGAAGAETAPDAGADGGSPSVAAAGTGAGPALAPAKDGTPDRTDPACTGGAAGTAAGGGDDDHDRLLRRLRELGELHKSGVLTDDEFAAAKSAVLARF